MGAWQSNIGAFVNGMSDWVFTGFTRSKFNDFRSLTIASGLDSSILLRFGLCG